MIIKFSNQNIFKSSIVLLKFFLWIQRNRKSFNNTTTNRILIGRRRGIIRCHGVKSNRVAFSCHSITKPAQREVIRRKCGRSGRVAARRRVATRSSRNRNGRSWRRRVIIHIRVIPIGRQVWSRRILMCLVLMMRGGIVMRAQVCRCTARWHCRVTHAAHRWALGSAAQSAVAAVLWCCARCFRHHDVSVVAILHRGLQFKI